MITGRSLMLPAAMITTGRAFFGLVAVFLPMGALPVALAPFAPLMALFMALAVVLHLRAFLGLAIRLTSRHQTHPQKQSKQR